MIALRRHWLWLAALAALLLIAAAACGDDDDEEEESPSPGGTTAAATETPSGEVGPGVTDTEILLGHSNDLAGTGGTPYGIITPAMKAYFNKVNEEDGGVCGRDITLLAEDDQYQPALALEKAKKLVEQDEVLAFVGALGTAAHLGAVDYLNDPNGDGDTEDGVPDLFVSTGYSGWGDAAKWPWTIGYIPDYVSDASIQAEYINENFPDAKVGILYQNDAFGKDYLGGVKDTLTAAPVSEQSYEASATDISSQILTIKDAGADLIFLGTTPGFAAKAIVAAHTQDYRPQFFQSYVNAHTTLASLIGGGTSPDQLATGFAELEGTIATNYILSAVEDADDPAMVEHKRIMESFDGPSLSTLSVYGQSLAELVVEALDGACDNLNRDGLLASVESIQGFSASVMWPGIEVNLGPDDHYAIQALQPVQITKDGTLDELGGVISIE
jgi:branched-chain amino acid transport system substrate-binding protein